MFGASDATTCIRQCGSRQDHRTFKPGKLFDPSLLIARPDISSSGEAGQALSPLASTQCFLPYDVACNRSGMSASVHPLRFSRSKPEPAPAPIALFTIEFSPEITPPTNARRAEVPGPWAEYAAGPVIFVDWDFGGTKRNSHSP